MFLFNRFILLLIFFIPFYSCKQNTQEKPPINPFQFKNELIEANKILSASEDMQINDYIERKGWKMNSTKTGLRYWIYKKGNGRKVQMMSIVRYRSKVELINGYVCYMHKEDEFDEIQIGRSTAPSGLEQGLLLLHEGDRANLIVPSHLAYGLLGDQNKIPRKATLIYDIEVLSVR